MVKLARLTRISGRAGRACEISRLSLALVCAAAVLVTAISVSAQVPVDQPIFPDAPGKMEPKVGGQTLHRDASVYLRVDAIS